MFLIILFFFYFFYKSTYEGYTSCTQINSNPENKNCNSCLNAYIDRLGSDVCYWNDKKQLCGTFDDAGYSQKCSGSQGLPDSSGGVDNAEILNDIQKLQNIEKDLLSHLDDPEIQPADSTKIIGKINDVSQMRNNLYKLLNDLNSSYKNSLTNSREVLTEQDGAIGIVEKELNRSKRQLSLLEEEKNNKIRLIEINSYYGQSYDDHANMMKLFIYILLPIIGLSIFFKYGYIPSSIYIILNVVIMLIGLILFWKKYSKIYMHDKMNYPEYNWTFDASTAPGPDSASDSDKNPWPTIPKSCIGSTCCPGTDGPTIFDNELGQCIPNTYQTSLL